MSISYDLRDFAQSVAKKFDHHEVTKWHLLYALKKRFSRELSALDLAEIEKGLVQLPRSQSNTLSIELEVDGLLSGIISEAAALQVAGDLAKSLLSVSDLDASKADSRSDVYPHESQSATKPSLESTLKEMNSLIGLDQVKNQVLKLISVHQANQVRLEQGMKKIPVGLHCVFTGSPGTGKTTVARHVAEMYHSIGLLPISKLIEVDRSTLVAGYVGQTAIKVQDAVQSALGGVLFIDEAYSLISDAGAGFGDEAVATLVKLMEDHRDSLAVIVAGYEGPMKQFVESNQGLKSRFQTFINFPDYSAEELLLIFQRLCHSHEMQMSSQVEGKLLNYLRTSNPTGEHGNARFVRNLFEKMYLSLSHRAASDGQIHIHEVLEFSEEDIPSIESRGIRIGFAP